jgi:predicted dehydrogenase
MAPELRVGIAGYGTVGTRRRAHIDEHPNMRLVGVCDQRFAQPECADGVRFVSDYRQLLREELDVLFVSLPNYLAPEVTVAGLQGGLHVFCEKPPGREPADVVLVREAEAANPGLKLMYGFNHRYHHSVREAKRIIESGELGEIIDLRGVYGKSKILNFGSDLQWRTKRELAGGGILLDQGIHMLDMMRLFGGDFTEINSFVHNSYWHHDVEDNAYALMRGESGIVAMLHSSATQWRHRFTLDITLTKGAIALAGILSGTKSYGAETITVVWMGENDLGDPREQTTRYNEDHSWREEIFDFAEAILEDKPVPSGSSLEALKTMELVYRVYLADPAWARQWGIEDALAERAGS